ncbi:hypothetical protein M9Y10_043980 [Tritrichomonas musculus]|uniref:Uncharacterized protein n=1 Tax=Tritrichomonas musculus TaxID=1915356 RepID=A0ABR2K1A4_9EUKA
MQPEAPQVHRSSTPQRSFWYYNLPEEEQKQYDQFIRDQEARQHVKPLSTLAYQQPSTTKETSKEAPNERHEKKTHKPAFESPKKPSNSHKEAIKIIQEDFEEANEPPPMEQNTDTNPPEIMSADRDRGVEPIVTKEKYKSLQPTHKDKSYKQDQEIVINIREGVERTREDNSLDDDGYTQELSNILKRLEDLEDTLQLIITWKTFELILIGTLNTPRNSSKRNALTLLTSNYF